MAKKRVTLPKNFDELITAGDVEALKAVYDKFHRFSLYFLTLPYQPT